MSFTYFNCRKIIWNIKECRRTFGLYHWVPDRMLVAVAFLFRSGIKMSCSIAACTWATRTRDVFQTSTISQVEIRFF